MQENPKKRSLEYLLSRKQYEKQEQEITEESAVWEHLQQTRQDIKDIRDAITFLNPNIKYWGETLSKSKEITVRREHRVYYAILPSSGVQVTVTWGPIVLSPTATTTGWIPITVPDGAKIILQSGSPSDNVPCLVCVSNTPVVVAVDNAPLY